jgi:KUP system potassium uptake protein
MTFDAAPVSEKLAPTTPAFTDEHEQHGKLLPLAVGALGVVYGDIGTSPLYALKECVHGPHAVPVSDANVLSLLSLLFWSVTLVVTGKYLNFIMRADNGGEGGTLALLALLPKNKLHRPGKLPALVALVLFGAALLYGDGIITPAVSVLSAVEGLRVATHVFDEWLISITVGVLLALFAWQKRGTASIGRLFGPIMIAWFFTIALLGAVAIVQHPRALSALNPWHIPAFFLRDPWHAFLVLGSVVLCITGAEALYADMGHFGRRPIKTAWYAVVFPALVLNYFGQGALLLDAPEGAARLAVAANPFYALVPKGPLIYPLVALATAAAVIASQAMISGAFSVTRQAIQLGCLPRLHIKHTSSKAEGQIYMPLVNWGIAAGCITLVLAFRDSSRLAGAYGIAVTGTMAITSIAFYNVARQRWRWSALGAGLFLVVFSSIDLAFLASNTIKLFDSGYVPVVLALAIFTIMRTWKRGRELLAQFFARASRPLDELSLALKDGVWRNPDGAEFPLVRVPGVAVFMTGTAQDTPPLLLHHVRHVHSLHERVLLVTVTTRRVPRVIGSNYQLTELPGGLYRLHIYSGFMESPDVPSALAAAVREHGLPVGMDEVTYFLGRETLLAMPQGRMGRREEALFAFLTRNSQNATRYFGIPPDRVVELGMQIDL